MPEKLKLIELFPNSGHHFLFLPFDQEDVAPFRGGANPGNGDARINAPGIGDVPDLSPDQSRPPGPPPLPVVPPDRAREKSDRGHFFQYLDAENKREVVSNCETSSSPWNEIPMQGFRFMRWRFGRQAAEKVHDEDTLGIWLAVDTNIGSIQRGLKIDNRPVGDEPFRFESSKYPSPYIVDEISKLDEDSKSITLQLYDEAPLYTFEYRWAQSEVAEPIDVDLVVDFGNTRTVALLLEGDRAVPGTEISLKHLIKPVFIPERGTGFPDREPPLSKAMLDSCFVLHEPTFAALEPPSLKGEDLKNWVIKSPVMRSVKTGKDTLFRKSPEEFRVVSEDILWPHLFVEMAPLVLGREASDAMQFWDFEGGGVSFMSSPKRYVWDTDPVKNMWHMAMNPWSPREGAHRFQNAKLRALVLSFFREDGHPEGSPDSECEWSFDHPPHLEDPVRRPSMASQQPVYPRADSITWMALAVIEAAYRQMQSEAHRRHNRKYAPRRFRRVHLTYPSGWTGKEIALYKRKWRSAVDIFSLCHLEPGQRLELAMESDEALAAQLPFIFSEIQGFPGSGGAWMEMMGSSSAHPDSVCVLSIDIGGGTTDFSILRYKDRKPVGGVALDALLHFKDSSSVAGDVLVRNIIERVLLPSIGRNLSEDARSDFEHLFTGGENPIDNERWKRIVRLSFVPKVIQWLEALADGDDVAATGNERKDGSIVFRSEPAADFADFVERVGLSSDDISIHPAREILYNPEDIEACIEHTFGTLFESFAKFVSVYGVDLVVVTGKTTEQPKVREMLERALPVLPNRIIFAKDFPVGDDFPFSRNGKLSDAKTATALGAALHRAIRNHQIPNWDISFRPAADYLNRNYWVSFDSGDVILSPDQEEAECVLQIGSRIGRRLLEFGQEPEPVYLVRWHDPKAHENHGGTPLTVRFRRVVPEINSDLDDEEALLRMSNAEHLEIESVFGEAEVNGEIIPITDEDVELKLCTLEAGTFWMDRPRFAVEWPEVRMRW